MEMNKNQNCLQSNELDFDLVQKNWFWTEQLEMHLFEPLFLQGRMRNFHPFL